MLALSINDLEQDPDVLDTWASSWLMANFRIQWADSAWES